VMLIFPESSIAPGVIFLQFALSLVRVKSWPTKAVSVGAHACGTGISEALARRRVENSSARWASISSG